MDLLQKTEIKQKADLDYFNGFRTAVKLLNFQSQFLRSAYSEVSEEKFKDTVKAWEKTVVGDMNEILKDMEDTMIALYGNAFQLDTVDDCYVVKEPFNGEGLVVLSDE